jgi:DNA-binding PadR family transcriptional regulator
MRERANLESRRLADQILSALEDGPLSRTAIGDRFFRYTNRNDIGEVLRTLEAAGFVVSEKIETDGRPVEMWRTNR